jgi:hypothetical protein
MFLDLKSLKPYYQVVSPFDSSWIKSIHMELPSVHIKNMKPYFASTWFNEIQFSMLLVHFVETVTVYNGVC